MNMDTYDYSAESEMLGPALSAGLNHTRHTATKEMIDNSISHGEASIIKMFKFMLSYFFIDNGVGMEQNLVKYRLHKALSKCDRPKEGVAKWGAGINSIWSLDDGLQTIINFSKSVEEDDDEETKTDNYEHFVSIRTKSGKCGQLHMKKSLIDQIDKIFLKYKCTTGFATFITKESIEIKNGKLCTKSAIKLIKNTFNFLLSIAGKLQSYDKDCEELKVINNLEHDYYYKPIEIYINNVKIQKKCRISNEENITVKTFIKDGKFIHYSDLLTKLYGIGLFTLKKNKNDTVGLTTHMNNYSPYLGKISKDTICIEMKMSFDKTTEEGCSLESYFSNEYFRKGVRVGSISYSNKIRVNETNGMRAQLYIPINKNDYLDDILGIGAINKSIIEYNTDANFVFRNLFAFMNWPVRFYIHKKDPRFRFTAAQEALYIKAVEKLKKKSKKNCKYCKTKTNCKIHPRPVEPKPTEPRPVEPRPVEPRPVEPRPVERKPVEPRPVEPKPVERKPVEPRPVEPRPAERKPVLLDINDMGDVLRKVNNFLSRCTDEQKLFFLEEVLKM